MAQKLLSRDDFREGVFKRDNYKCVFCDNPAQDAHHILERRLWTDGGYYLDNGASVCGEHHIKCETTEISVEDVRLACGIMKPIIPDHLYDDQVYDKWGNPVMANKTRLRGELFFDESVQKILGQGGVLSLFTHHVKYSRTWHATWSPGITKDDRVHTRQAMEKNFSGRRVIATKKMDGETTAMYRDHFHARSLDSPSHPSQDWCKNFWAQICYEIPEEWRICGENVYAQHSIKYDALESYFFGFSVWNERNMCLDWDTTLEWFELLGITSVPILYDGVYDEKKIRLLEDELDFTKDEGYVIRLADGFAYSEFSNSLAKFVRKGHVSPDSHHWRAKQVIPNGLKDAKCS
jgi:hypothetical protein